MKSNIKVLIGTLTILFVFSFLSWGWMYNHNLKEEMHKKVIEKQNHIEVQSTEIERLDSVISTKEEIIINQKNALSIKAEKIAEQEKAIIKKSEKIIKQQKTIKNKDAKINDLQQVSRSSNSTKNAKSKKSYAFEATAYIALCDSGCTGITATGVDVRNSIYHKGYRVIAVDPRVISLGSLVRVNTGDESFIAIASDTGGAIKGNKIDILVESEKEAWNFGRRAVSITVLKEGR